MKWSERWVPPPLDPAPEAGASLLGTLWFINAAAHSAFCTLHSEFKWLPSALNAASGHYFDRARSLPGIQVQLGKTKWSSIRVLRPVFRFGRPACISQHLCSKNGFPCESRTHLRGFADHCLGCSANGTLKWRMGNARCRMLGSNVQVLTAVCSTENNWVDDDGSYRRGSVPSAVLIILATVFRTFSG